MSDPTDDPTWGVRYDYVAGNRLRTDDKPTKCGCDALAESAKRASAKRDAAIAAVAKTRTEIAASRAKIEARIERDRLDAVERDQHELDKKFLAARAKVRARQDYEAGLAAGERHHAERIEANASLAAVRMALNPRRATPVTVRPIKKWK